MSDAKKVDIIIFGATGFTGLRIAKYLARTQLVNKREKKGPITFAIAGREEKKLRGVRAAIASEVDASLDNDEAIPIIIANLNSTNKKSVIENASLDALCARTRCIISAVGPYRFYGEEVVAAAVKAGIVYLDVTGEPQFMESMLLKYDTEAKRTGALIVHACGFDSIPADLGVLFTSSQFPAPQRVSQIESFFQARAAKGAAGHYATWESAVEGFSDIKSLVNVRKELKKVRQAPPITGPKLKAKANLFQDKRTKLWCVPFPGSDASVVRSSQQSIYMAAKDKEAQSYPQYAAYFGLPKLSYMIMIIVVGIVLKLFTMTKFTKKLLLKYPKAFTFGFFSHAGPTEEQMANTFFQFDFYARGVASPTETAANIQVHTRVTGPEPGYVATPILVVETALTLLNERSAVPTSGVVTPAAALHNTGIIKRLHDAGVRFEIITDSDAPRSAL